MASKLIFLLSGVLGLFFLYAGVCKLYPVLDQDVHLAMKKHFVNYARVSPLRTNFDIKFKASQYRSVVGSLEIVGGFGLLSMSGKTSRSIGFLMLIAAELAMIHSYLTLGDNLQKYMRLIAAVILLTLQMFFERWVSDDGESEASASSSSSSSSTSSLSSSSSSSPSPKSSTSTKRDKKSKNKDRSKAEGKKES